MECVLMNKILLVEDDQRLASLVQSFLQQHGFEVQVCDNGLDADSTCRVGFDAAMPRWFCCLPYVTTMVQIANLDADRQTKRY